MRVIALNSTLKTSDAESSTDRLLGEVLKEFARHEATGEIVRAADPNIKPGVTSDEGPGDDWPALRQRILGADILLVGTPIWLGQPSSVCKRVLERMNAFLSETNEQGRMVSFGKVAAVAVVGNEDGAHHVCAELYRRSMTLASPSPPRPAPTGSVRRCKALITRSWTNPLRIPTIATGDSERRRPPVPIEGGQRFR